MDCTRMQRYVWSPKVAPIALSSFIPPAPRPLPPGIRFDVPIGVSIRSPMNLLLFIPQLTLVPIRQKSVITSRRYPTTCRKLQNRS
ncbi:unnamed protein product [Allacma fusca]|uniref:Uncharacterized protein n=1 Tax=Allacma fusca TaxID=39272 RepID=A0A8J2K7F5_9HEXA|nr:unnamed protein product [Allacma fusca]